MDTNTPDQNTDVQETVDGSGTGTSEAGKGSEAAKAAIDLEQLSETLGRKFEKPEDALKALKGLNSLVGDRTIADLRSKAKMADTFENLVKGYAEEEGITPEEARKALSELAQGSGPLKDERVDGLSNEVTELKQMLQEKDFLADHPEAKAVLKELKALAAQSGQSLSDAYESSSLKGVIAKAAAAEEREKAGGSMRPSTRSAVPNSKAKEALARLKTDQSGDAKDQAVREVLGI